VVLGAAADADPCVVADAGPCVMAGAGPCVVADADPCVMAGAGRPSTTSCGIWNSWMAATSAAMT